MPRKTLEERFWEKVDRRGPDECWEWQAGKHPFGYGIFRLGSLTDGTRRQDVTHRVVWELVNGPIPDGLFVLHRCDNPPCVNVFAHLFLGTQADNMADMEAKGRGRRPTLAGEDNGNAKLTAQQVREIRRRYAAGGALQIALAAEFGVSQPVISSIVRRKTWRGP